MQKALFILAAAVAVGSNVYADKVSLEQTPPAVQQAIRSKAGGSPIEDIDRETRNGQVIYEASFKSGGTQQELVVSEAGTILRDVVGPSTGLANSNVTLANRNTIALSAAPPAVQRALQANTRGATIESLEKGIWNGQNIYQAAYTQNGQRVVHQVTESGKPVVSSVPATGLGAVASTAAAAATTGLTAGPVRSPLPESVNMQLRQAPAAVQTAAHKARDGATVEHFERGVINGQTVYQVGFRKDGQPTLARMLANGTLIGQGPGGWTKSTASTQPGVVTQPSIGSAPINSEVRYAGLSPSNVPVSNGVKVEMANAPSAVQRTIQQVSAGAQIEDLERGVWNGRTVYEAAFKRGGQHVELQLLEDGSVLTTGIGGTSTAQAGTTGFQPRYAGLSPQNVPLSGGAKLAYESAPEQVKQAVNHFAAGAQIEDMERGQWNGRTVYEAAFKKNGQHIELQVLEDGSLVSNAPAGLATGAPAAGISATGQQ